MKVRAILVCTLLLLAAVPSFALPLCGHCNEWNRCESAPGDFEYCIDWTGTCDTDPFKRCSRPFTVTVASEWTVASIEVHRPSLDSITVSAPAAAAKAEVPTSESVEQK